MALLTSILLWILLKTTEWVVHRVGFKITIEYLFIYLSALIVTGLVVWQGKRLLWPDVHTSQQTKLLVFIGIVLFLIIFLLHVGPDNVYNELLVPISPNPPQLCFLPSVVWR